MQSELYSKHLINKGDVLILKDISVFRLGKSIKLNITTKNLAFCFKQEKYVDDIFKPSEHKLTYLEGHKYYNFSYFDPKHPEQLIHIESSPLKSQNAVESPSIDSPFHSIKTEKQKLANQTEEIKAKKKRRILDDSVIDEILNAGTPQEATPTRNDTDSGEQLSLNVTQDLTK